MNKLMFQQVFVRVRRVMFMPAKEGVKEEKMTRFRESRISLVDVKRARVAQVAPRNLGANEGGGGRSNGVDSRLVYPMAEVSCLRYLHAG